jgi:hypothetical protein
MAGGFQAAGHLRQHKGLAIEIVQVRCPPITVTSVCD